jgi:hypothetical protein
LTVTGPGVRIPLSLQKSLEFSRLFLLNIFPAHFIEGLNNCLAIFRDYVILNLTIIGIILFSILFFLHEVVEDWAH